MQCHLLASLLRHHGVKVLTAPDGEQAFQLLREIGSVNAVVIDWDEPENSGRQFCDWLNNPSSEGIREIPILAVSAQFDQEQTKELTKAGGCPAQEKRTKRTTIITRDRCMPKPGRIDLLGEKSLLRQHSTCQKWKERVLQKCNTIPLYIA